MNQFDILKEILPDPKQTRRSTPSSLEAEIVKLPILATVDTLVEDRGFAFVLCASQTSKQFMHVTANVTGRRDFTGMNEGDLVLCQLGSNPRKPGQTCMVQWAFVDDLKWNDISPPTKQSALDALRAEILRKRSIANLNRRLCAKWYARLWKVNAPADLHDPVLFDVWRDQLARLDLEALREAGVSDILKNCLYDFRDSFDPESPTCSFETLLTAFTPAQLTVLGEPQKTWLKSVAAEHKPAMLEWYLLSTALREPNGDHKAWLTGSAKYEAEVAERILERDAPLSDYALQWVVTLANCGWISQSHIDRLATQEFAAAVVLFAQLSSEIQHKLLGAWGQQSSLLAAVLQDQPSLGRDIARGSVLSIDLETDGERIWEIGIAHGESSVRIHDERLGTDLSAALADLAGYISRTKLVIGHNILAWDWPILEPRLALDHEPLIWDTLLVQYLLEPQTASHALGGTHHAEADAEAALELFVQQLVRVPAAFAARAVTGQFKDSGGLQKISAAAVMSTGSLARPAPEILEDRGYEPPRVLLVPDAVLRTLDWVPNVTVVQVDPQQRLPQSFWQIDVERLEAEMTVEQKQNPFAQVLLAIANQSRSENIALRRNMLPTWLLERYPNLASAADRASMTPKAREGIYVSPLPKSAEWWAQASETEVRALLPDDRIIIVDQEASLGDEKIRFHLRTAASLFHIPEASTDKWLHPDRAAQLLDPHEGWQCFRTLKVPKSLAIKSPPSATQACRPYLATRQYPVLHPGSQDQATYWIDVMRSFRATVDLGAEAVPIILVGSTKSRKMLDLLATALAEIEMGELRPAHRSWREHLMRAEQRGFGIVDFVDHWSDWHSLATEAGVVLQPVIEALPVEEWFAIASTADQITDKEETQATKKGAHTTSAGPKPVPLAKILEVLPKLIEQFLDPWLERTGIGPSNHVATIIDARADTVSTQIRAFVDLRPLTDIPFQAAQRARLGIVFDPLQITREDAPSDMASMRQFLIANWQPLGKSGGNTTSSERIISDFKPTQTTAMDAIRTRESDVMVALPTGEGKSVLFQVPAMCRGLRNRRLTLVLSPLKALMRDQVARLCEQGFAESVDYLSSDRPTFELSEVLQGVLDHRIVLLYVAPERLRNATFVNVLEQRMASDGGLEYVVFDETHCVNQWGYEFRPDYFYVFKFLLQRLRAGGLPDATPFLLLSATITASDRQNLKRMLDRGSERSAKLPMVICPDPETFSNPLRSHIQVEPLQVQGNLFDKQDLETALAERLPHLARVVRKARQNRETTGQRSAVIIFVSGRRHAEDVADRLAKEVACDVESFHAGLDSATRDDIYTCFKDGGLDVLVATKAFGMGMDIPDIHWVVHLSPPVYLEDYLQEVGRIGRGEQEKIQAGLGQLSAAMLFSPADFENIRSFRARNELRVPEINTVEIKIVEITQVIDGQKIAIVPQHGFKPYENAAQMRANATKLRMALHWLEEAEHLDQLGMVADLITVELFPEKLTEICKEESTLGMVAQALLSVLSETNEDRGTKGVPFSTRDGEGIFGGITNWLSNMIGLKIEKPSTAATQPFSPAQASKAVVNLSRIRMQCQIRTMGDTMASLVDLQKRGGLALLWKLEFAKRPLLSEPPKNIEALFETVGGAVRKLIRRLGVTGRSEFDPVEWLDEADWALPPVPDLSSPMNYKQEEERQALLRRYRRYRRAYLHGFRSLARASGVRSRQSVHREGEEVIWQGSLPPAKNRTALDRCDELLKTAPPFLSFFAKARKSNEVEVYDLIRIIKDVQPHQRFHTKDLEALLRLFSAMTLVSAQPDLVPLSYILEIHDVAKGLDRHPELIEKLNEVNALAEARTNAMEVFANLPETARQDFIGGYFANANAAELKSFLETQLGQIEFNDDTASSFIRDKLDQLRATKATEFFDRYQNSEEPVQWEAIRHPFDQHLMVNAGPGAGKTSVLVGRIVHLIREQHIKPSEIIVLAFNRAVVFEIKKRIRELFRSLGYAAYAAQVRVSTFHSLAKRSLNLVEDRGENASWDHLMNDFATRLSSDEKFREQVAGGCRSILVDEFQDVTDDVYSIIRNLHAGSDSHAGVMVIGDDDQDILRWQRVKSGAHGEDEFAEIYFDRFWAEFGGEALRSLELKVNFRSGAEIVTRSQSMISGFFARQRQSRRLKQTPLRERSHAINSTCERIDWTDKHWDESVEQLSMICRQIVRDNSGSLAVLCRSNGEVAQIHHRLVQDFPRISVQSGVNMRIADLRHVGHWIDFLATETEMQDRLLTEALRQELLGTFRRTVNIPETRSSTTLHVDPASLWDLCCEEHVHPHLSHLIRFLKALQIDEYERLRGSRHTDAQAVISTIHKVKGLEFDNVVIVPSKIRFGKPDASADALERDAAEEARLLYVAMTRAKSRLVYFVGDRELGWARSSPKMIGAEQEKNKILEGAKGEVNLEWSMHTSSYHPDPDADQSYIEQEVHVGDPISLGGRGRGTNMELLHCGPSGKTRQIGFLSQKIKAGNDTSNLEVSAVIRFRPDKTDPEKVGRLVAGRGWGYAVLVAGRLR